MDTNRALVESLSTHAVSPLLQLASDYCYEHDTSMASQLYIYIPLLPQVGWGRCLGSDMNAMTFKHSIRRRVPFGQEIGKRRLAYREPPYPKGYLPPAVVLLPAAV